MKITIQKKEETVILKFDDEAEADSFLRRVALVIEDLAVETYTVTDIIQNYGIDRMSVYYLIKTGQLIKSSGDHASKFSFEKDHVISLMAKKGYKRYHKPKLSKA